MNASRMLAVIGLLATLGSIAATPAAPPVVLKTTELGRGSAIVFVHGLGSSRMVWMPTARKLSADHRVVLVDLPGHGDSPAPDPFTFEAAAEALDQVLAKQGGDSTVVVGHGMGGLISLLAARAHPEHVKGLILIDTGLKFPTPIPDQQKQMFLSMMDANFDDFLRQMFVRQGRDSAQGKIIHAQAALVPRKIMEDYLRVLLDTDASSALKGFKCPLLYIGSEKNWPADKSWATLAKERGFDAATAVDTLRIGASGGLIMADQPDTLAAAIAKFAAKVVAKK